VRSREREGRTDPWRRHAPQKGREIQTETADGRPETGAQRPSPSKTEDNRGGEPEIRRSPGAGGSFGSGAGRREEERRKKSASSEGNKPLQKLQLSDECGKQFFVGLKIFGNVFKCPEKSPRGAEKITNTLVIQDTPTRGRCSLVKFLTTPKEAQDHIMEKELQIVFLMGNQHKGRGIGDPFWVFETERTPGPFPRIPTHLFVLVLVSNICTYKRENNRTWGCISDICIGISNHLLWCFDSDFQLSHRARCTHHRNRNHHQ